MRVLKIATCLAALPVAALAQQAPPATQLQTRAEPQIGAFWSPSTFQIVAKKFDDNPLKPTFVARFQIAASNPQALYVPNGQQVGPDEILVMTVPAKTARTFYGTADLAYSAGAWTGPIKIENPATKLGKPLDLYTVPTVVLGSDQYKQAVAQQISFSLDQRKAQFQKQLDALQQTETAKLADLEKSFEGSLNSMEDAFTTHLKQEQSRIAALRASDGTKVSDIEKAFETDLQNLNSTFADKLTKQQAVLTGELADLLNKSRLALADQQKMVEASWTAVVTQQKDELAKLTPGLQLTKQAVDAKVKLAEATVEGQKNLIALQHQVLANNATIATQKAKIAELAEARLDSFKGTWGVNIQCDEKVGKVWGIHTTEAKLILSKQVGGLLDGTIAVIGGDLGTRKGVWAMVTNRQINASLQVQNTNGKPPIQLAIASAGGNATEKTFLNFLVQLNPAGVLTGSVIDEPNDCAVVLSH